MATPTGAPAKGQFTPKQINANLSFEVDGKTIELINKPTNFTGMFGLDWSPLDPATHFGKTVVAKVDILGKVPFSFRTHALLISELTPGKNLMGVKFIKMDEAAQTTFGDILDKQGTYPPYYSRKFPRLPAKQFEVLAKMVVTGKSEDSPKSFKMEVEDLNPQGMMLDSEDPNCAFVQAGNDVTLSIDVSGTIGHFVISTVVKVRRIIVERSMTTGKKLFKLGTTFVVLDAQNKKEYFEILKQILMQIKDYSDKDM